MKNALCFKDQSQITYELLSYLAEHPEARDSIDGITQWWLLERKIQHQETLVKKTLSELLAKGFVLKEKRYDSKDQYWINKQKTEEIQAFLKQGQE